MDWCNRNVKLNKLLRADLIYILLNLGEAAQTVHLIKYLCQWKCRKKNRLAIDIEDDNNCLSHSFKHSSLFFGFSTKEPFIILGEYEYLLSQETGFVIC